MIQIIYDDLVQTLPTRVMVTEEGHKKRFQTYERSLRELPLPEAWDSIFPSF